MKQSSEVKRFDVHRDGCCLQRHPETLFCIVIGKRRRMVGRWRPFGQSDILQLEDVFRGGYVRSRE